MVFKRKLTEFTLIRHFLLIKVLPYHSCYSITSAHHRPNLIYMTILFSLTVNILNIMNSGSQAIYESFSIQISVLKKWTFV